MQELKTLRLLEAGPVLTLQLASSSSDNRINQVVLSELLTLVDHLEDAVRSPVLAIRGSAGAFCGGIDWENFAKGRGPAINNFSKWQRIIAAVERLTSVTVAVIE